MVRTGRAGRRNGVERRRSQLSPISNIISFLKLFIFLILQAIAHPEPMSQNRILYTRHGVCLYPVARRGEPRKKSQATINEKALYPKN